MYIRSVSMKVNRQVGLINASILNVDNNFRGTRDFMR